MLDSGICLAVFEKESDLWAVIILALSGLTDLTDGWIARHFDMVSTLGKAIDPIADKLTQLSVLYCLVSRFSIMWIAFGVLIVKELFMGTTSLLDIQKSGIVNSSKWHGKVTTTLLYAMMLFSMVLYGIANIKTIMAKD